MALSAREIVEVMQRAKELGLKHVKMDGFEAFFEDLKRDVPTQIVPHAEPVTDESAFKHMSILDEITEDEVRYWSTPYYDELQAQKELHKKQLEEEAQKNG